LSPTSTEVIPEVKPGGGGAKRWTLRRYLVAGVLVWLPIVATIWVVSFMLHLMDRTLLLLPVAYRPEALVGFALPGVGAVFALLVLLVTGVLSRISSAGASSSGVRRCSIASQ